MKEALFEKKETKPFLKWAGGKGQLLDEIRVRLPAELKYGKIKTYVEPFVGGGAVFFHIAQRYESIEQFILNDVNEDLIHCYRMVQTRVEEIIEILQVYQKKYFSLSEEKRKEFYLKIRRDFNREKTQKFSEETAAKLIFLNRTCFNGLYRVNRKGLFNVPFGRYKNPAICQKDNLKAASGLLQRAELLCGDFEECCKFAGKGVFYYLDPPYRPISKTASFTSYAKDDFSEKDQIRLVSFCKQIHKKGAEFLLSNSDPQNENPHDHFFEDHYSDFVLERVKASRAINCKGDKRGRINEIIVMNYDPEGGEKNEIL
ncbi:MAG TPA: DNA adenine methylase [Anaerohalosphaeraceae bacterium]|nr:DNA adenine methylase [Anaerohalosphaeraceae bacterium]HOL88236.1 DNA adenine methylase [Anaerohalosphaeraceae bacterium]HPP56095.1 DNA adenine methylase [Anaerohalosphaeraceae bacterium]